MEEPYREGVATHPDPEPCADAREDVGEALVGAPAGWPLSREIIRSGMPTPFREAEGNTGWGVNASPVRVPRGPRPHARWETPHARTGRSRQAPATEQAAKERPEATTLR